MVILQFVKLSKCLQNSKIVLFCLQFELYVMPWSCHPGYHSDTHQSHNAFI